MIQAGNFGEGSIKRLILNQAVPLTLAQIVQLLYNIVDRAYIGHMPGDEASLALTGLGVCFPIITLISAFINWISVGSAPLCSMARGGKTLERAQNILTTAFTALLCVGVTVSAVAFALKRPLL